MMGTGPFAIPTFRSLVASEHDVCALITRPQPSGRGKRKPPPNPMFDVAAELGVPVELPTSINDPAAIELLNRLKADLLVVCDYGQILSNQALECARLGGINLHASLLPAYRGAAPIHWAIYDGRQSTGVTVIHMTSRLDAGPNLVQTEVDIGDDESTAELEPRLAEIGTKAVLESIDQLISWDGISPIGKPQDSSAATKAPRLSRTDGIINWSRSAQQIANQIRAFKPWPGSFTFWHRSDQPPLRLVLNAATPDKDNEFSGEPGTVVHVANKFLVATGGGLLRIDSIQPAGRNVQPWDAFLNGYRVQTGDRFGNKEDDA